MRIALLGPLDVTDDDGRTLRVAGARLRALLIRLALDSGRTVGIESLTEAVWAGDPPAGAANALQTLVSRLRRSLPADTIAANPIGYQVTATVDVDEFDSLVHEARAAVARGDLADARVRYDAALARWRGAPLADVAAADFARAPIARLTEARAAAAEERLAVRLALGETAAAVAELEELVAAQPLRERPHQLLIAALGSAGRAADAVAVYVRLRDRLAEELGIGPSAELTATYAAMLRGERASFGPDLFAPDTLAPDMLIVGPGSTVSAAMPDGAGRRAKGNLRPAFTSFVGREADVDDLVAAVGDHRLVTLVGPGGAARRGLPPRSVAPSARISGMVSGSSSLPRWVIPPTCPGRSPKRSRCAKPGWPRAAGSTGSVSWIRSRPRTCS